MNDNGQRQGADSGRQGPAAPGVADHSAVRRMACRRASRAWQARHSAKLTYKRGIMARRSQAA